MSWSMGCQVEFVENGLLVRFSRVVEVERAVPPSGPHGFDMGACVQEFVAEGLKQGALPKFREDWQEQVEDAKRLEKPKMQRVHTLKPVAVFCVDDAALVAAVRDAKNEERRAEELGLSLATSMAAAVPVQQPRF